MVEKSGKEKADHGVVGGRGWPTGLLAGVLVFGQLVEDGDDDREVALRLEPPGNLQAAIVPAEPLVELVLELSRVPRSSAREDLGSFHFLSLRVFYRTT